MNLRDENRGKALPCLHASLRCWALLTPSSAVLNSSHSKARASQPQHCWQFGLDDSLLVVRGARVGSILCIRGSLAAYLLFTHWAPWHPFLYLWSSRCLWLLPAVPWEAESPLEENHYSKHMFQPSLRLFTTHFLTCSPCCTKHGGVELLKWTKLLLVIRYSLSQCCFPHSLSFLFRTRISTVYSSESFIMRICISSLQECEAKW